jgi:hypothetical protein
MISLAHASSVLWSVKMSTGLSCFSAGNCVKWERGRSGCSLLLGAGVGGSRRRKPEKKGGVGGLKNVDCVVQLSPLVRTFFLQVVPHSLFVGWEGGLTSALCYALGVTPSPFIPRGSL